MPAPFATAPAAQSNPLLSCQFQPEAEQSCAAKGGAGDRGLTEEGNFRVSVFLRLLELRNLRLNSREHECSTVPSPYYYFTASTFCISSFHSCLVLISPSETESGLFEQSRKACFGPHIQSGGSQCFLECELRTTGVKCF